MLNSSHGDFDNIEDPMHHFSKLLEIAEECIQKTSASFKRSNPWFNEDCKKSVKERRAAVRKFQINPTTQNLANIKIFRAKARRTVRQAKKKSWQTYVSKLNARSSVKKVWDMVRKISGKNKSPTVNHLKKSNSESVTDQKDIADYLRKPFPKIHHRIIIRNNFKISKTYKRKLN